jgi:hypothetical protein
LHKFTTHEKNEKQTYIQIHFSMKAIQINTPVNLNSGLQIPAGAVAVVAEGLAQVFQQKDGLIPAQIVTSVYTSKVNYEAGKSPVDGNSISDFNPVNYGVRLPVVAYQTQTAEDLLVTAVYIGLDQVYPGQCEIIDVANPADITPVSPEVQPLGGDGVTQQMAAMSSRPEQFVSSVSNNSGETQNVSSSSPETELSLWGRVLNLFS